MLVKPAPRPPAATLTELIQRNMEGAQGAKEGTALSAKEFASQVNFYYRSFTAPLINAHAQLKAMFATMAEKAGEFKAPILIVLGISIIFFFYFVHSCLCPTRHDKGKSKKKIKSD